MSIWQFSLINGQYPKNGCQGDKIQPKYPQLQLQKTSFTAAVAILPLLVLLSHEKTLQTTLFPAKSSENYSDDDYDDNDNGFGENPTNDLLLSTKCVRRGVMMREEKIMKKQICSPLVSTIL